MITSSTLMRESRLVRRLSALSLVLIPLVGCARPAAGPGQSGNDSRSQLVAGGNEQVLVFVRGGDPLDVSIVPADGSGPVRPVQIPFASGLPYSDGRWLVLADAGSGSVYACDLNDPSGAADLGHVDGATWTQVLGLDAGRLLVLAYGQGGSDSWTASVIDLAGGQRTTVAQVYAYAGAIHGSLVALSDDPGAPAPVPAGNGGGLLSPPGGFTVANPEIERIDLSGGAHQAIPVQSFVSDVAILPDGRIVWSETGGGANALWRAYDPATGQTSTAFDVPFRSDDGLQLIPLTSDNGLPLIGAAGLVVQYAQPNAVPLPYEYFPIRNELHRLDGSTVVIQEFDPPTRGKDEYWAVPTIVGRLVVYRDWYTGDWQVYDSLSEVRLNLAPFAD
jgi:hypothetical protein